MRLQLLFRGSLLAFGLVFLSFCATAQSATILGKVLDENTKEPLISATVKVGTSGTVTDFDGQFEVAALEGVNLLEISYIGYETEVIEVTVKANESKTIEIALTETVNLLQTATVTSGRYEKALGEATVSLDVIKAGLIESTNATAIDQAIEKIPGVNFVGGQANIRGGSGFTYGAGSRVLLLVNDLPALQSDAGTSNWGDIPIESVEQVEVIKGAASALYGSSAMNGIINVRTSYARSEPETKISLYGGVYDAPKDKSQKWWNDTRYDAGVLFSHKQKIKKLDLVFGGRYAQQKDVREHSDNESGRVSLGMRYRVTDRFSIGFNSTYNQSDNQSYFYWRNAGENIFQPDTTTLSNSTPKRFFIDPFLAYFDKKGNHHKLSTRYFSIDNKSTTGTDNFSDLYYGNYQFQRKLEDQNLVFTGGLVAARTDVRAPLYGDTSYVLTNNAAYVQVEKKLFDRLNISAGVRYERNKIDAPSTVNDLVVPDSLNEEGKPIFRFGMNYQAGRATYIRGSWGQGYRFPTIAEKFITTDLGGTPISPNPNLGSETGWSTEIGLKQGFQVSDWQGFVDVAGFWMEYEDMIEFILTNVFTGFSAQNIGNTVIKGIDGSVQGQGKLFGIPTNILAGYTYVDPKFKDFTEDERLRSSADYNILKYRSKHTFKVDVESQFGKWNVGVGVFRNSHIEAIDGIFNTIIRGLRDFRAENDNGFFLVNARVGFQANEHLKIAFIGKNLTNELYTKRPGLVEPTRLWTMRVDYKF